MPKNYCMNHQNQPMPQQVLVFSNNCMYHGNQKHNQLCRVSKYFLDRNKNIFHHSIEKIEQKKYFCRHFLLVGLMGFLDFWFLDIGTHSCSKSSENWEIPSNEDRFWSFLIRIILWKIEKKFWLKNTGKRVAVYALKSNEFKSRFSLKDHRVGVTIFVISQ